MFTYLLGALEIKDIGLQLNIYKTFLDYFSMEYNTPNGF